MPTMTIDWRRQDNGTSYTIDLRNKYVNTATVQFRGVKRDWSSTEHAYTDDYDSGFSVSTSGTTRTTTPPSVPSGWTFNRIDAVTSLTVDGAAADGEVSVTMSGRATKSDGPKRSCYITDTRNDANFGNTSHWFKSPTHGYSWIMQSRTRYYKVTSGTYQTQNPTATVNSITTSGPSSLNHGSTSSVYNFRGISDNDPAEPTRIKLGDNRQNTVSFASSGSNRCEVRIVIEYMTRPTIGTWDALNVADSTVTLRGNLADTGGGTINRYVEYSRQVADLGTASATIINAGQTTLAGLYDVDVTGLTVDTTYYFRAYVVNTALPSGVQRVNGATKNFTTEVAKPTVTTEPETNIDITSVRLNGTITRTGGDNPQRSFEWGAVGGFTDSHDVGVGGTGTYYYDLTGLDFETEYQWRAYAVNAAGRVDGATRTFETLYPSLPAPDIESPDAGGRVEFGEYEFIFTLTANTDNPATHYHARLRIGELSDMSDSTDYETKDDRTDWEYWTGAAWAAFPVGGVVPGTKVKKTIESTLTPGIWYWDCASHDGYNHPNTPTGRYGINTPHRRLNIVLRIENVYILTVAGIEYDVFNLKITETSNGELGQIQFEVSNEGYEAADTINHNDVVAVGIIDAEGIREDYTGRVRSKNPQGTTMTVTAIMGDGLLAERIVDTDYAEQDIGLTVEDIIDNYCQPLTSNNIDTATGFDAPIQAKGKTALQVLEFVRRNYGLQYYVDADEDVHLYKPSSITAAALVAQRGGMLMTANRLTQNQASIETDLTGFTTTPDVSIARSGVRSLHGDWSLEMERTAAYPGHGPGITGFSIDNLPDIPGAGSFCMSFYVYTDVDVDLMLRGSWFFGMAMEVQFANISLTGKPEWQMVYFPKSFNEAVTNVSFSIDTMNDGVPIYFDCFQFELRSEPTEWQLPVSPTGDLGRSFLFVDEPSINIKPIVANYVTVNSPTNSYTADLGGVAADDRIDKVVNIGEGDQAVCQGVADALLDKWGKEQLSITGKLALNLSFRFKEKVRAILNYILLWIIDTSISLAETFSLTETWRLDEPAGDWFISDLLGDSDSGKPNEELVLQKKEHTLSDFSTNINLGDIELDNLELLSRVIEDTETKVRDIEARAGGRKNVIINGNFLVNQRGHASGGALAAGEYGLDRWKAGAGGCNYTFSTTGNKRTITIPATRELLQVIEGDNLQTGDYTLSWEGTAEGKIGAGAYHTSPITASVTGGSNLTITFGAGTVANVQLERGAAPTPFEQRHYSTELSLCQRYYWEGQAAGRGIAWQYSNAGNDRAANFTSFPVTMRVSPTMAIVTAPTYVSCTHKDLTSRNENGFCHRVDLASASGYRAFDGVYSADAEL